MRTDASNRRRFFFGFVITTETRRSRRKELRGESKPMKSTSRCFTCDTGFSPCIPLLNKMSLPSEHSAWAKAHVTGTHFDYLVED